MTIETMNRELRAAGVDLADNNRVLESVLAGCGDCIKILDLDGRLQFMSEGGKRVMEVENFEALKGCPWPDFWAGEGNAQATDAIAAAKAGRIARFRNAANTAKGTPRYWDVQVSPIAGETGEITHLLSISRDITEEWKASEIERISAERQKFFADELVHRVKNTLSSVMAIANQTFRGETFAEARTAFGGRIKTLSDAYNTLTESSWSSTMVRKVVEGAVSPYQTADGRIASGGPDHAISPHQALTLALAINELATNATKYGALSVPTGRVQISWSVTAGVFRFEWRESGGPAVVAPTRSGFGSRLIKHVLAADFGGAVEISYEPAGLVCVLTATGK